MVPQAFGRGVLARAAYQYYKRVVLKQIKGHGTSRKLPEHVRSDLPRHLDAIEALVNPGPFLLGISRSCAIRRGRAARLLGTDSSWRTAVGRAACDRCLSQQAQGAAQITTHRVDGVRRSRSFQPMLRFEICVATLFGCDRKSFKRSSADVAVTASAENTA